MFMRYAGHLSAHLANIFVPITFLFSAKPTSDSHLRFIYSITFSKKPLLNLTGNITFHRYYDSISDHEWFGCIKKLQNRELNHNCAKCCSYNPIMSIRKSLYGIEEEGLSNCES